MKFRRVLVTGATGVIGGVVVRSLVSSDHEVVGSVRSETSPANRQLAYSGVQLGEGDKVKAHTYEGLV